MLNNLQQIERHDYSGCYFLATVVANNDPDKLERVKVSIPNLFESEESLLPWVAPLRLGVVANKPSVHGTFGCVPSVGSQLIVILQDGNPLYPLYIASPITSGSPVAEAGVNYPNRYGVKDPAGNVVYVDTTSGQNTMRLSHASGTSITINNDGSITLVAVGTINSQAPQWNHTGPFHLTGDMVHDGNLLHNGNETINGAVNVSGEINLVGPMEITGPLSATGIIHSDSNMTAPDFATPSFSLVVHRHNLGSSNTGYPFP